MDEKYVTFVKYTIFLIILSTQVTSQCIQNSPCSCSLPDGSAYDFSSLAKQGPLQLSFNNRSFWLQPCKDVSLSNITVDDGCQSPVSLCSWNKNDPLQKGPMSLGTVAESKLELETKYEKILKLVYRHKQNITNINLICCPSCSTALKPDTESLNSSITNLLLLSPHLCKHEREGLSAGSVFFILLLVFAGIYFIGGALALKFLRGATGWEMLPNHEFWCTLGRQFK
ncbi:uncharacterized protein LOC127282743 isoform X2 [Leptopilina boulardi]|nr:uncharacterized protein LOC127282743 isoform X2 [Leptopilina boulardi]